MALAMYTRHLEESGPCNGHGLLVGNTTTCRCFVEWLVPGTMCAKSFVEVWGSAMWVLLAAAILGVSIVLLKAVQGYRIAKDTNRIYMNVYRVLIVWQIGGSAVLVLHCSSHIVYLLGTFLDIIAYRKAGAPDILGVAVHRAASVSKLGLLLTQTSAW